jgi:aryl-alcohol dehydrogenase-like predicted oxidoreductase
MADGRTLVLGTAQLCAPYGLLGDSPVAVGDDPAGFLAAAQAFGFTAVDTAPSYPGAEAMIGTSGGLMAIHTKLDPTVGATASLEGSLARLRCNFVDVLYFHDPTVLLTGNDRLIDEAYSFVGSQVGALGVSVYDRAEFTAAVQDDRISVIQVQMNVLTGVVDDNAVSAAAAQGKRVLARSVLLQGVLLCPPKHLPPTAQSLAPYVGAFQTLAGALERTPMELALGAILGTPGLDGVITGAGSVSQLGEIVAALSQSPLSGTERAEVLALLRPDSREVDPRFWVQPQEAQTT